MLRPMKHDISRLLDTWEYKPGQVLVRRFAAKDGTEKIQLRLDLGLLQMNAEGRPDGKRPLGHESFFHHLVSQLEKHRAANDGSDEAFVLSGEDCARLQQEAIQYHHRYICFYQLGDYASVVRDAERNLEVFDFVDEFAETDELSWALQQFRPQLLLMLTRARGMIALEKKEFAATARIKGLDVDVIELRKRDGDDRRKLAEEILAKVNAGGSFTSFASSESDGSQKREGGDLGLMKRSVLRKEFAAAIANLKAGQRTGVIEMPEACFLLQVEEIKSAQLTPLAEVRDEIEKTLLNQERARLQKKYIERLKKKAFVRYF